MVPVISGFLNVLKPVGVTSHDVVARVRRITGVRQVGHAGTLDPDASGVLPIALGVCTRLLPYMVLTPKVYQTRVSVGSMTTTGDASGRVVARSRHWLVSPQSLMESARWLRLSGWQIPSRVSAVKQQGRRSYQLVQRGKPVWPAPRRVEIQAITDIQVDAEGWTFQAEVGSGTYIRALVRDWAEILGVALHVRWLERIQVGPWHRCRGVTWEQLESAWPAALESWSTYWPWPVREVDEQMAERVSHGELGCLAEWGPAGGPVVALTHGGQLLAVIQGPPWRYRAVFAAVKEGAR
ncbi:MAG: tRNA pseudouridine(55) synthase TruB [Firmicutes bacterium]|nr:tRNA pseudouridine(55) synthase TruB [Bacillota bacterium]